MKTKSKKQPNKQEIAYRYINENYLAFGRLRRDMISDQVQIQKPDGTWRDFTTADIHDIVCKCSLETGVQITPKEVQVVTISPAVPSVHPLRDYVYACANPNYYDPSNPNQPDWIDLLAQRVIVEGDEEAQRFWRLCFKKWFVGMVASWLKDDIVNHQVLVLIGPQGIYKTTWLDYLLPPQLRMYGCKMGSNAYPSKDDRLRVAEYGLINLDEIDAISSTRELNIMKSLITTDNIVERPAYRYNKERYVRIASFCASGNKPEFLTDITGNRRFLPFKVTYIMDPRLAALQYECIYAQALYLFESGFQYWFDQEENRIIDKHNEDFRAQTNEEQLIFVHMAIPEKDDPDAEFLTASDISSLLSCRGTIKKPLCPSRLGVIMRKAGFQEKRTNKKRGFIVKVLSDNEVQQRRIQEAKNDNE